MALYIVLDVESGHAVRLDFSHPALRKYAPVPLLAGKGSPDRLGLEYKPYGCKREAAFVLTDTEITYLVFAEKDCRPSEEIGGAVQRGPDEPGLFVLPVPEAGAAGEQLQKHLLDRILRVGGQVQAGAGQPQQHGTVLLHQAVHGFIGTK